MIVIGTQFDASTARGKQLDIDEDRGVQVFVDARGHHAIHIKNGTVVTSLGLTPEAAEALLAVLIDVLEFEVRA